MTQPRIDQQIAVAASHMKHVAAEIGLDPWLVDQADPVRKRDGFIPATGLYLLLHVSPCQYLRQDMAYRFLAITARTHAYRAVRYEMQQGSSRDSFPFP